MYKFATLGEHEATKLVDQVHCVLAAQVAQHRLKLMEMQLELNEVYETNMELERVVETSHDELTRVEQRCENIQAKMLKKIEHMQQAMDKRVAMAVKECDERIADLVTYMTTTRHAKQQAMSGGSESMDDVEKFRD